MNRLFVVASTLALVGAVGLPTASAQVTLPFSEGFEGTTGETYTANTGSLTGAPQWGFETDQTGGRLRMGAGAGFYGTGNAAATLDRNPNGAVTINYLTLTLDMSNYNAAVDEVRLNFSFADHGEEPHANDRVWVRGSSADTYIQIADLSALQSTNGVYQTVSELPISQTLAANGQSFSATTQIRFGQEDNFPATSPTGSDGFSFDDIELFIPDPLDMAVVAVTAPADGACGTSGSMIDVQLQNLGAIPQSGVPVEVVVTGDVSATFNTTTVGPTLYQGFETISVGPIDLFTASNISVQATVQLANDPVPANDQVVQALTVTPTEIGVNPVADVCPGSTAALSAVAEPNVTFGWYDVATGGSQLGTGDTFSPTVSAAGSYWVQREALAEQAGPNFTTFGTASYSSLRNYGITFDTTAGLTIESVVLHANGPATAEIELLDSTGAVLDTAAVPMAGTGQPEVATVDLQVPAAGTGYEIILTSATTSGVNFLRNSNGASFPYTTPSGSLTITGNAGTTSTTNYYYFYDLEVISGGCDGERTEVLVDVDPNICASDLAVTFTPPAEIVAGQEASWAVSVENIGPDEASGVELTVPLPAGVTFVSATGACTASGFPCTIGNMASGAVSTSVATYLVPADWDVNNGVAFSASVAGDQPDGTASNDSLALTSAVIQRSDIVVTAAGTPDFAGVGDTIEYTVTVTNNGPSNADGVSIASTLNSAVGGDGVTVGCDEDPAGVPTCTVGALDVGASATVTVTATVPADTAGIGEASFEGSAAADEAAPGDEIAVVLTDIEALADLSLTLAATPDPVAPSGTITYTVDVTNNGPAPADDVRVYVTLDPSLTSVSAPDECNESLVCGWESLEVGATASVEITATVGAAGTVLSGATATSNTAEGAEGDESASVATTIGAVADLVLTAAADAASVTEGEVAAVRATVTNNGPSAATDVQLTFTLPEGLSISELSGCTNNDDGTVSCPAGSLEVGASAERVVGVATEVGAVGAQAIEIVATAREPEASAGDEAVTVDLTVDMIPPPPEEEEETCQSSMSSADGGAFGMLLILGLLGTTLRRRRE